MHVIKRYWNALDEASRKALKKIVVLSLVLTSGLVIAMVVVFSDVLMGTATTDSIMERLPFLQVTFFVALAIGIYGYVLVGRAHRAIKANLFAHPAPGRITEEDWTGKDGLVLALVILGVTTIPVNTASLVLLPLLPGAASNLFDVFSYLLWPIVGIALAPYAAKRYIPL